MIVDGVPDLLRRYIATPYISTVFTDAGFVTLETNDMDLSDTIRHELSRCTEHRSGHDDYGSQQWKLIRDDAAPRGGDQVTILSTMTLQTLLFGNGTIITVDRERREVLGFIAPDVTTPVFSADVLPLILNLLLAAETV